MRTIALSLLAHLDDVEILCAGKLVRLSRLGWTIYVATVCQGGCGSATLDREEIARIRRLEATAATDLIDAS